MAQGGGFDSHMEAAARAQAEADRQRAADAAERAAAELALRHEAKPKLDSVAREVASRLSAAKVPGRERDGWVLPTGDLQFVVRQKRQFGVRRTWGYRSGAPSPWFLKVMRDGTMESAPGYYGPLSGPRGGLFRNVHLGDVETITRRIIGEGGMGHQVILDNRTRALYVASGWHRELPEVLSLEAYCAQATLRLLQAWQNRS